MIRTHQLTRRFGRRVALDRVDLELRGPGVFGLLGPNGAGKTTLMRVLSGFLSMTSGTAEVAGFDVFEHPMKVKERVGYLPERPPLDPELTVGEYLRFAARLRAVPRHRQLQVVGQTMERTGLSDRENERIASLSKGLRQRVGIAQAVLHDPPVVILDEPTSGLDPTQLEPLRALIRALGSDRLVWLSTHVLHEVERMCDRVVVLHEGRIAAQGATSTLAQEAGLKAFVELVVTDRSDRRAELAEVAGVTSVERVGDGSYRLEGDGIEASLAVVAAPWGLVRLARQPPSLGEAFLRLVRR